MPLLYLFTVRMLIVSKGCYEIDNKAFFVKKLVVSPLNFLALVLLIYKSISLGEQRGVEAVTATYNTQVMLFGFKIVLSVKLESIV